MSPGETNPYGEFDACLATSSRLIDRAIASVYDANLRAVGLRSTQLTALVAIARHADGVSASDLTGPLRIDQSTLSRNLRRLEEMGVIRGAIGSDERRRVLTVTSAGRRAIEKALPLWREAQQEVAERLGPRVASAIMRAASKLSD